MKNVERSRKLLWIGIIGCLLYVIGDFLFAATGKEPAMGHIGTDQFGFMVRTAYLEMGTWRMVASIICGFVGSMLYYMGFHRMYGLLKIRLIEQKDRKWLKLFRVAYMTGTVAWTYVHAMFMIVALVFKFVYQSYGDMQQAADIANRIFYANAAPMLIAYILCDLLLTIVMLVLVWTRRIPLKTTAQRVLASFCNPMLLPGVVGNLLTLLPWPINQLDHGTESFGHALVLLLGLILLREMEMSGELEGAAIE